jgi:hypothetical protein
VDTETALVALTVYTPAAFDIADDVIFLSADLAHPNPP